MIPSNSQSSADLQEKPERADAAFWRDPVIWTLVVAALGLRIAYNLALHSNGHTPTDFVIDEREYFGAAHMLAEGRGFSFFDTALWIRPPLYVVFLAAIMKLLGTDYLPVLISQSVISAATLLPLGWLGNRLRGVTAARWTVALGLLYLPLTLFAGLLLSETLFLFAFAWALVALVLAREALSAGWKRRSYLLLCASGILIGVGALTRATALAFVPLAALWLFFGDRRAVQPYSRRMLAAGAVVAACGLTILPWTVRSYVAYNAFVPVDTTSGYNLWLASVGVKDEARLRADLEPLSGPIARQNFAYAAAFKKITSDPAAFIDKGLKESLDLWRPLFSAEERQVPGFALGRVPAWHLLSLLLFDDILYVAVLALAVAGLLLAPPHPLKLLIGLWVLLWVGMSFVFFAVTRFALPVVTALLPVAGTGITFLWPGRDFRFRLQRAALAGKVASALALFGIATLVIPPIFLPGVAGGVATADSNLALTQRGIQQWGEQEPYREAEELLKAGKIDEAIAQYKRANATIADTRYGLAAAFLQKGETTQALAQLTSNEPQDRVEPFIIEGEAARRAGKLEAARSFFNARTVKVNNDEALNWAWDHLDPPLTTTIEIGSGLDIGYVRGFYSPEVDERGIAYRWSSSRSEVRRLSLSPSTQLKWSGWRPSGLPGTQVVVYANDASRLTQLAQFSLINRVDWQQSLFSPGASADATQGSDFLLDVNAFVSGGSDPRLLGVRLSVVSSR